jgi:putative nucleotidyltransferase with HDIG domain
MKYVHIDSVESGQYLGRTIFSSNGAVLLSEGVQLTVYMITTLRRIGVTMLYIKDENLSDVEIVDVVSEENKRAVMQKMGEMLQSVRSGKEFYSKSISISVDRLLEDVMQNREVLLQLSDIRTKDNEQYVHALNVCTMAALTGINMGLTQTQIKELAVGALLHDVGKVDEETDDSSEDIKKHHTWRGFELLKSKREFSLLIAHVAFQHHEAPDGSGQPRGLDDEQIHQYAKIVAVANTYDNLLFNPETGEKLLPHDAIEQLTALAGTKLDREIVIQFLRTVSIYPTGVSVRLNNREVGVVVGQHRGLPGRPIVRVVKKDDEELSITEIDMAKHTTVFIESVLM